MTVFGDRRGRRIGLIILLACCLLLGAGCSTTSTGEPSAGVEPTEAQRQQLELLNQTAEGMYQKVLAGDVSGGRMALAQLSDQIPQIRFEGITTVEGMNALTQTLTETKKVFQAVRYNPLQGQTAATRLRLAADALMNKNQPLWLGHYKTLQDDVNAVEKASVEGNRGMMKEGADALRQHVEVIHPSLIISRDAADVARLDSLVTFIGSQTDGTAEHIRNVQNAAAPLRQTIDKLFMKKETTAYLPYPEPPHPILWTLTFGSVILAALAFAGWRLSKKDGGLVPVRRGGEETF
ncbi:MULTISPECIES: sporulation protein YpjB [Paenibacillus]|uniref:sporulation protein YpjB n=1 Tax=Paenibacillus TaxID=44249 RepID=UPI0022B8CF53|nr:sporulation protein YpjB [Paenibacillus caseinilyticus]MCZ8520510.1 sporulation protein YpjB [Paenibacillus caseinilyticus]